MQHSFGGQVERAVAPVTGTVDAVVVGAGHHGLVAANLLADAGWDVLVAEATDTVGGAVRSDSILPGYTTDVFSAFYPLAAASPVLAALELDRYGLEWSHSPSVLAAVLDDDRAAVLSRDVDVTAESLGAFAPRDAEAWHRVWHQWQTLHRPLVDALFEPFPPLRNGTRLLRRVGTGGALRLARLAVLPARRLCEEQFEGVGARALITGNAMHADLSPEAAGSGLYGWLLTMLGQEFGFPVPVGGAHRLPLALARRLEAVGGSIRLSTPVERVLVADGTATGVVLAGGETVHARRGVLADVNAPTLFGDLVGHDRLPARMVEDLGRFEWDTSTLKIDWALTGPVPWTARAARGAGTVHLGADPDTGTAFNADLARGRVPERPFVLFGQMTTADATRSPEGTESAWAYTHLPDPDRLDREAVDAQVEKVEALVEARAPGFRSLIAARRVLSPLGFEGVDPNLVGGSISLGTEQPHQQLFLRPVPGLGGASTPIDRLYLAGASAHPGGGVHGACGSNAARAALHRATRRGSVTRRGIDAAFRRIYR